MKRFCIAFLTVLALVLCIASACFAASNWDPSQGTRDKVKVIPDRVQEGDIAMVYITLTNHTEEALLSPIQLYDPDGNLIGDFDGAILQPGESVSWSEIRTVTEAQMKDRAIRFTAVYRYRDKEGAEKEVRKTLRGNIYPDTKRTPEPTPTSTPEPTPRPEDRPRVFLYSVLKEEPDSTSISVCCIDEAGDLWSADMADAEEDILQLLWERRGMKQDSNLKMRDVDLSNMKDAKISDLAGMAQVVTEGRGSPEATGAGIGENAIYALQYDTEGNPTPVLLGVNGDAVYENTDPNAQTLYQYMRMHQSFYAPCNFATEGLTPRGFRMVTVRQFFGMENVDAKTAVITAAMTDCEEGFIDVQLTEEDREKAAALLERGVIIRKESPWLDTGGTMCYFFRDETGKDLGCIETCEEDGLAVGNDGKYRLSLLPESTDNLTAEEKQLLHMRIGGVDYELGKSTPRDLIRNGWYCSVEFDGSFDFTDENASGDIYVYTRGGGVDEPIISVNCHFAYTLPVEYCGFDGIVDPDNPEDTDTVWRIKYLEKLRQEIAENGEDEDDYNLNIDPYAEDDEDEKGDGLYWTGMEEWLKTLGEEEEEEDNGMTIRVKLSDGHTLRLFTSVSPVSVTLSDPKYVRLGPEKDDW